MTPEINLPEFCPRPTCRYFDRKTASKSQWYRKHGRYWTDCRTWIPRFRCRECGKTCSTQTFSIHYWTHSTEDYKYLLTDLCSCAGLRQHGRSVNRSFRVVQNRLRHLSRNCLALLDAASCHPRMEERLALDGFESYTRSQYFPNNFTILVGGESDYVHASVLTVLRRKGKMTDMQRCNRDKIDAHWKPRRHALRNDCALMLRDLAKRMLSASSAEQPVVLWTDEHKSYPPAIKRVGALRNALAAGTFCHRTISSRAPRTHFNPLFPVNYVDRQIRKDLGEHVRETVKQGRETNCQMERMAIYLVAHNFLSPHRMRDGVGIANDLTHADVAGIPKDTYAKILSRLYTHRHLWDQSGHRLAWQKRVWQHLHENPPAVDFKTGKLSKVRVAMPRSAFSRHFLA